MKLYSENETVGDSAVFTHFFSLAPFRSYVAKNFLAVLDAVDVSAYPHVHLTFAESRTNFPGSVFSD